jgi:hypothetical protein
MYSTEEALVAKFSGVFTGNEYTRIGTAFHRIIEEGDVTNHEKDKRWLLVDDIPIIFHKNHVDMALKYKAEIQPCFHEIRCEKTYQVLGEEITLTGAVDVLHGLMIRDIKTKYSTMRSEEDYTDSIQWKAYCDIFEVPLFTYDVFGFEDYDPSVLGHDVSCLVLHRYDPIPCNSYPTIEFDIIKLLEKFLEYVKFRKYEHFFPDHK